MPLIDGARLIQGIKGLTIRIPALNNWLDPKYSEISCAEAFLILSKLRTVEGLKNEDSGQFINLEELSKIDKEKLKNALAPMRELEELIKISFN
jgi:CBS domain-containing protein